MSVNAEYNYNKVLEQIRDEYRNIKNSDEYKHASRRTKEKIDNIFKELHADYLNKERALSETYRAIEEQDLAEERVNEGRKARKDTNLVSRYLGDFAKSAGEHTVNDILKLTALGQQTLGYKDAAQRTAQLSQDISENMEDAFGRKAEWSTKENEWRPDSLESAIDAGLSTAIDVGTLIYSPLNAGANMAAGKAAATAGQKVASTLGNGIVGKLAGGAVNAIPTSVAMSLPELYGDQFDFDEYGNVVLPKSVLPTYLLSIPHGMVEHLGIDPRKPFTQTIRKSIWKALKDYANPINIAKRAGGEGLEEGLQDAMSMFNKRASDAMGTDKSIMQVMGEWMADVEEKYPQLLQSVFLGGIGGALMFEDAGNIKSNKELRAQRQNVQRQINDILAITDNLEITNSDADRNQLINDIDRALQGYDVRIADNSVSMAARQQAAKDKQNDQEQQQLVRLKQEQDKAADMLNNYVYNMDAQNVADNSNKSRFLNLPFADNNDYDYNTIYDNLMGEALAQQLRDNTERNKGNQEKYLQEWNTLSEEQQGQYKDANEYIAERMATDEEANDVESRRTEFAQEYANLSPEDRAKYKDSADYVERRINQETQKQRQKSNIGRSSRMLSAITSQRNKQERINRQQSRIKGYKADVANIREWKRKSLAEQEERKQQIVEQLKKQRQALREWQIDQRLKSEQDDFENEKRLAALREQREKTIKAQEEALNEFIENDKTEAQINEIQAKLRQFEQRQDVKSLDDAINLLSKFQFGIADRKSDYKMNNRNTSTLLTYDNDVKNSRENMSFTERTEEAKQKIKELKTALNNIEDKDSDYFKEVAAADYMINTLQNELNKDLSDSEIHEIIEAIDDLYNRFFYLGEEEKQEQPQQQQQNNEYEEYADEIAQHEAEREQPQQKNETPTIQMKNDLKGKKLGIKADINTSKAERNSSIDSRLNERMTFRDREDSSKSMPQNIGNIIHGDMSQRFSREDIANSVETARQKAEQIARALGLGEQSKPNSPKNNMLSKRGQTTDSETDDVTVEQLENKVATIRDAVNKLNDLVLRNKIFNSNIKNIKAMFSKDKIADYKSKMKKNIKDTISKTGKKLTKLGLDNRAINKLMEAVAKDIADKNNDNKNVNIEMFFDDLKIALARKYNLISDEKIREYIQERNGEAGISQDSSWFNSKEENSIETTIVEEKDEKASSSEKANNSDTTSEAKPVEQKQEDADKYENYSFKRKTSEITKEQSDAIRGGKTVNIIKSLEVTKGKDGYRMNFDLTSLSRSFYPISGEQIIYTQDRDIVDRYAKAIEEADKNGIILDFGDLRKSIEENKQQQPTQQTEAKQNISELTKSRDAVLPKQAENRIFKEDEFKKRMARLRSAANRIGVNPFADPQIVEDALYCSCYLIESGARKFADYCKQMVENLGEQAKVFKDYLAGFYMMAKKDPRLKALNIDKKEFSTEDEVDSFDIDSLFTKPVEEQPKQEIEQKQEQKDDGKEAYDEIRRNYELYKQINDNIKGEHTPTKSFEDWNNEFINTLENTKHNLGSSTDWYKTEEKDKQQLRLRKLARDYYINNIAKQKQDVAEKATTKETKDKSKEAYDGILNRYQMYKDFNKNRKTQTFEEWLNGYIQLLENSNPNANGVKEGLESVRLAKEYYEKNIKQQQAQTEQKQEETTAIIADINNIDYKDAVNRLSERVSELLTTAHNNDWLINVLYGRKKVLKDENRLRKLAQEIFEGALCKYIRDNDLSLEQVLTIYKNQPTLNDRTNSQKYYQAYSTPIILAKALTDIFDIKDDSVVFEPTAGNGLLLSSVNPKASFILNEIQDDRLNILKAIFGDNITQKDALEMNMPKSDFVITNPPFGKNENHSSMEIEMPALKSNRIGQTVKFKLTDQAHMIAIKALKAMKADGKAVIIYGAPNGIFGKDGDNARKGGSFRFEMMLFNYFNVVGCFEIDKGMYYKQGTGYPVACVVIDGKKSLNHELYNSNKYEVKRFKNWQEVFDECENIRRRIVEEKDVLGNNKSLLGIGELEKARELIKESEKKQQKDNVKQNTEKQPVAITKEVKQQAKENAKKEIEKNPEKLNEELAEGVKEAEAKPVNKTESNIDKIAGDGKLQTAYEAVATNRSVGALVPTNLAKAINTALKQIKSVYGDLVKFIEKMTGNQKTADVFSAEQIDALSLYADKLLNRNAMICSDQTGLGKGRIAAGAIQMSKYAGHIPFFCTEKDTLFSDLYRDMKDTGAGNLRPFFINEKGEMTYTDENGNKAVAYKKIGKAERERVIKNLREGDYSDFIGDKAKYDYIVGTYSQFQNDYATTEARVNAINRLLDNNDVDLILDEVHNVAAKVERDRNGQIAVGGSKKKKVNGKEVEKNKGFRRFIEFTQKANSIMFLSATWAKTMDNMGIYSRAIGMTVDAIERQLAQGGQGMMELLVMRMAIAGKYIRREQSFAGVKYTNEIITKNEKDIEEEVKQSDQYNKIILSAIEISQRISKLIKDPKFIGPYITSKYGEIHSLDTGEDDKELDSGDVSPFSQVHNFVNYLLLSLKADRVAEEAIKQIKAGLKPVIALEKTAGRQTDNFVALNGLSAGDSTRTMNMEDVFRGIMIGQLKNIPVKTVTGEKGLKVDVPYEDLPEDIKDSFERIMQEVEATNLKELTGCPIDRIRYLVDKAGYKIDEVTGRNQLLSHTSDNEAILEKRKRDDKQTISDFNSGEIDCVILNESGSTGISLHAKDTFKDKKQRIMLIAQPFGDINTMMQMLGRIHRVGQVQLPVYKYVMTSLLQELRVANSLQDKLKSLNANTSSNKEGQQKFTDVDINNAYGREAIGKWLAENIDIAIKIGVAQNLGDRIEITSREPKKITGRIAIMPQSIQADFWQYVLAETEAIMNEAKARGEDILSIPSYDDADAFVKSSSLVKGKTIADNYYIKTVDMAVTGTPATIANGEARAMKGETIATNKEAMDKLKEQTEEFYNYTDERLRNSELNVLSIKNKLKNVNKSLFELLNTLKPGMSLKSMGGEMGIVESVKVRPTKDSKVSNPLIGSKIIITMASPTKSGTTTITGAKYFEHNWHEVSPNDVYDYNEFKADWDYQFKENSNRRIEAEVITGNLFNAIEHAEANGLKVAQVQFRTKDGGHKMQFVYLARNNGNITLSTAKTLENVTDNDFDNSEIYRANVNGVTAEIHCWRSGNATINFRGAFKRNSILSELMRKSEEYFGQDSWVNNEVTISNDVIKNINRFIKDAKTYNIEFKQVISEDEMRRRSEEMKKNLPKEFEEDDVHFSISQSKVSKAIGIDKLNSIAKKIGNALNQKLGLGLVVCKDSAELGNKLREAGAKIETIPQGAEGCVFNGNVYLVADNIQDGNRVYTVLAHEIAGHVGAEKIYPHFNALMKQLLKLENSDEKIKAIFDDVRKNYNEKDDIRVAAEVFAKVMEQVYENENSFTGKIKNLVNFFIKKVKDFFRSLFGMNIPMSASEVYAIANNIMKVTTVKSIMKGEVARTNIYDESKAFEDEPVFSNDESLKALGMSERNGKASWTDERINYLIDEYGSKSDNRYSQAYATTIDPVDFLKLTLGEKNYQKLWKQFPENFEVKDLNPEKLKGERQTPFLIVEGNAKDPTRIIGHEGRHRLLALAKAGIKNVPVVVIDKDTKYNKEVMPPTELKNQKGQNNSIPSFKAFTQEQMIPIKESNRETLRKMFGGESDIQFSIPSDIFEFNAYLEREEKKQNNGSNVVQLSSMETFDKGVAEGKRLAEVERKEQQEKIKTAARLAKLAKNRQKGLDYLAQQERVNKAIEESRKPKKTTLAQKVEAVENWLALKFANKRQRLVEFQDTIEKALGHKLADYMNPHRQLDTIDGRIQYRTEAFNNKYFKPLYDYLVKNGITYDDFNKFTYAMHAEERDKYIREINPTFRDNNKRGSGWDNAKMGGTEQQVLDGLYQKYGQDKLMNAGKMFWNMNKAVIDLQEQYGLIDKKTADNIRARYKYYTPLKHIADDEVTTKVVERALGRTSTAQDNLMFATAAIDTTIRWGEKNNAKLAMLNLANVYKTPMVEINRQKLEQYFNPETGEVEIRLDRSRPDNTITARANGVNYNITFKDEELYKAFTSEQRTSEAWNAIVKTSRVFTNMMGFVSTMANPDFGIANFVRDQSQSGLENIVYRGMKFASNAFHYALPAIKTYIDYRRGIDNEDTRLYKEFLENGGLTGYADMLRLDKRAVNLDKSISEDIEANKGVLGKLKKLAKNPSDVIHGIFGLFEAFNDSLESATRFGVYREARKTGTALEAAELAKNITINFNRHGSLWSSDMNALYLFSNANIQGTRKAWQLLKYAARDNKGRSIIGSLVAAGFISEILGHMFAGFDPDDEVSYYDKLEEWKKDGNLVIFTGGKKYVSMPLSPVVAFPYMIGRNTAAYMTGKKNMSTAITDIFSNFITTLNPLGEDSKSLGSIVPTPMRPLVDLWTNRKWNAAKIRPEQTNGMKKPEHQLYFDNKTNKVFVDLAKWLSDVTGGDEYTGGKIDWSPADMQYLAENYSGGLGKSLYKGYKLATSQAESLDDIPLLRRFRGETNEYSTAREYKDNQEIADRYSRVKSDRNFDYLNKNKSYIRISNIIKVADKQIDRIRERNNLSEAEKELAVTKIQKNANTAIRKLQ